MSHLKLTGREELMLGGARIAFNFSNSQVSAGNNMGATDIAGVVGTWVVAGLGIVGPILVWRAKLLMLSKRQVRTSSPKDTKLAQTYALVGLSRLQVSVMNLGRSSEISCGTLPPRQLLSNRPVGSSWA